MSTYNEYKYWVILYGTGEVSLARTTGEAPDTDGTIEGSYNTSQEAVEKAGTLFNV